VRALALADPPRDPPLRVHRGVATLAGVLVLAAGCSADTSRTSTPLPPAEQPAGTFSPSAAPAPSTATAAFPAPDPDSPLTAAVGWLVAYHSASWTDATPAAWIDRVRPYVTDALHASNETLRSGGGGTDWADYLRQHCTSTVTDTHAVIPPESPGTDTTANVHVTGTVHTTCTAGSPPSPTEQASATLVVVKTGRGWRVDQRLI
jgi:hypothetical protein